MLTFGNSVFSKGTFSYFGTAKEDIIFISLEYKRFILCFGGLKFSEFPLTSPENQQNFISVTRPFHLTGDFEYDDQTVTVIWSINCHLTPCDVTTVYRIQ